MNTPANHIKTTYSPGTPKQLQDVLESLHSTNKRVRIWYGDPDTGLCWDEEYDVMGYIGRSTGTVKVPLLVHSRSSLGGPQLSTGRILRVDITKTGETIYKSPKYQRPVYEVLNNGPDSKLPYVAYRVVQTGEDNQELHPVAAFADFGKANRWTQFMSGNRYSKA